MNAEEGREALQELWSKVSFNHKNTLDAARAAGKIPEWTLVKVTKYKLLMLSHSLEVFAKLYRPDLQVFSALSTACLYKLAELSELRVPVLPPINTEGSGQIFPLVKDLNPERIVDNYNPEELEEMERIMRGFHMQPLYPAVLGPNDTFMEFGYVNEQKYGIDVLNDLPSHLELFAQR